MTIVQQPVDGGTGILACVVFLLVFGIYSPMRGQPGAPVKTGKGCFSPWPLPTPFSQALTLFSPRLPPRAPRLRAKYTVSYCQSLPEDRNRANRSRCRIDPFDGEHRDLESVRRQLIQV